MTRASAGAEMPVGGTIGALTVLFFVYQVTPIGSAVYLPIALFAICAGTVLHALRVRAMVVWDPLLWFFTASAVYYGIGPLIFLYGDDAIVSYIRSYHFVDEMAIYRTNVLNVVSIAAVSAVYWTCMQFRDFGRPPAREGTWSEDGHTRVLVVVLVAVGWASRLAVMVLRATREDAVTFGILLSLMELSKAAAAVATYRYAKRGGRAIVPLLVIGGAELFFAIGTLMKQEVLEVLFLGFLGWFLARPSRRAVAIAVMCATSAYLVLVPVFSAARNEVSNSSLKTLGSSADAAKRAFDNLSDDILGEKWWWSRLSQTSAQSFAMDAYDQGNAGNTFAVALATPIPRVIWPDKPVVNYGLEFTTLVKGDASSGNTGAGFFAEAYWNLGWLGVTIMALVTGGVYAWCARRNIAALGASDLRWLPLAYLSVKMGYRPDDWFVATMVGTLPIMAAIWLLISQAMMVLTGRPRIAEVRPTPTAPSLSRF